MSETTELIAQQIMNGNINKRTWGDILYNVKVYGSVGDGVKDDTASIQAAIDYAVSVGGKAVFFPHGTYKVTALTNVSSVVLFGDNASFSGITDTINQIGKPPTPPVSFVYNVKDYGAKGDGVTDDAAAFNNTVTAIKATGGGILRIPPGKYVLSTPITIADTDIVIEGSGVQLTQLFFTGSDGIVYSSTNLFSDTIQIRDLSIVSLSVNTFKGISISFPTNVGSAWRNTIIENTVLAGSNSVAAYNDGSNNSQVTTQNWKTAIYLNNSAVSVVRDVIVRTGNGGTGTIGIHVDGYTVDVLLQGNKVYTSETGIRKSGLGEGLIVDNCMCINVGYGVLINQGAVSQQGVFSSIQNCHFNYSIGGVVATWQPQIAILNCLFYKQGATTGAQDINLVSCDRSKVIGNTCIVNGGGGSGDGIVINSSDCFIQDNMVEERLTGLWIRTGTTNNQVIANKLSLNTTNYTDQGTGTYTEKKKYVGTNVISLAASATSLDIVIPSGLFSSKPSTGFLTTADGLQYIIGFYSYDLAASTPTNARFNIKRLDGLAITAETIRFNFQLLE